MTALAENEENRAVACPASDPAQMELTPLTRVADYVLAPERVSDVYHAAGQSMSDRGRIAGAIDESESLRIAEVVPSAAALPDRHSFVRARP